MNNICKDIIALGADKAVSVGVSEFVFNAEFRKSCEENRCGNYGRNYTCPHHAGTADYLINRVKEYNKAVVMVCTEKISGYDDKAGMQLADSRIAQIASLADDYATQNSFDYMIIGGSNCKKCTPCKAVTGEKCPDPNKAFVSLSAFCIDVAKLSESCGIDMVWDGTEVSYYSILLLK
ncbi:MAG: DUF2284 domain-containing protein [Oscillospiraceae bacterium]|nr:DUF2284 domain-containing protein [Oscillospiraceae bacterium]